MKKWKRSTKIVVCFVVIFLVSLQAVAIYVANVARSIGDYGSYTANRKALAKNPNDPAALRGLGERARRIRDYENALIYFRAALRAEPDNNENRFNLAFTLARMGRDDEAISLMQQVAQGNSLSAPYAPRFVAKLQRTRHAMADKRWLAGDKRLLTEPEQIHPNSDMKRDR